VHRQRLRQRRIFASPDRLDQLLARQHLAGPGGQQVEQPELDRRQVDRLAAHRPKPRRTSTAEGRDVDSITDAREKDTASGGEPTDEELAEELNIPMERLRIALRASQQTVSLEAPAGENGEASVGDFIEDKSAENPSDVTSYSLLKEKLGDVLTTLTERERKILEMRFGLVDGYERTLEEIGKMYNVTRERIRQIEAKALRKLRHPTRVRHLQGFLETDEEAAA